MKSAHPVFDNLTAQAAEARDKVCLISEATPNRHKLFGWLPEGIVRQVVYQSLKAIDMALAASREQGHGWTLILEHKPQYSLPLYLVVAGTGRTTLFFVHGIQQIATRSRAHWFGFKVLRWLVRYSTLYPIHLELGDSVLPEDLRFLPEKCVTIPHPVRPALASRTPRKLKSIGVAGIVRADKPIAEIIRIARAYVQQHPDCVFRIGTPFWQKPAWLDELGCEIVDTSTDEQFEQFLASLDVVITDFDRDSFYFRPSGLINDAVTCGCLIICPDYPVLKAQISNPVRVGVTYQSRAEIPAKLDELLSTHEPLSERFATWRAFRSNREIYKKLSAHAALFVQAESGV